MVIHACGGVISHLSLALKAYVDYKLGKRSKSWV